MSAPRRLVVTASAGTGKTHALTGRLIGLLAEGAAAPETVLATTFTRKAAGEILERLLRRLAEAAGPGGGPAREQLASDWPGDRAPDAGDARRLLAATARGLDRLAVRTLDSHFADVAGWLAPELGLPPGWRLVDEDEDERLRDAAVAGLVSQARSSELAALLRLLHKGHARRSVHGALRGLLDAGRAAWVEAAPGAWDRIEPPADRTDEEVAAALDALQAAEIPKTRKGEPNKTWEREVPKWLGSWRDAQRTGDWQDLLATGPLARLHDDPPTYGRVVIPPAFLRPLVVVRDRVVHEGVAALCRSLATLRGLVTAYDAIYEDLKRRQRALRFEDLPRRLADPQAGLRVSAERLAARLGARTDHLLLDEFQDTSVAQWRALEPLARAAVGPGRSLFVVGDAKQAIYGWRGGDRRLLDGLPERLGLATLSLSTSFRSSRPVLALVNAVFADLGGADLFDEDGDREVARSWSRAFEPHEPAGCAARHAGAAVVTLLAATDQDGADPDEALRRAVVARVGELHGQARGASIGVLVRRRKPIAPLIRALRDADLPASGEGGNPLTDSEAVLVVLSLLWLADHPGDRAARFHVERSPFAGSLALDGGDEALLACLDELRRRLVDEGYGATLRRLVARLGAARGEGDLPGWDRERLTQLVDLGFIADERPPARPSAFVARVREQAVEDPRAERIRVMTIHGAKGLEFDAVVLPDLQDELLGCVPALWTLRPEPWEPIDLVFPAAAKPLCEQVPRLRELRQAMRARALHESLCLLYVALTRARRRVDVLLRERIGRERRASFAGLLRGALGVAEDGGAGGDGEGGVDGEDAAGEGRAGAGDGADGARVLWSEVGDGRPWHEDLGGGDDEPEVEPAVTSLGLAAVDEPRSWPRRSPSSLDGALSTDDLLSTAGAAARARGTIIHRWCAAIEWLDEGPDDEALLGLGRDEAARAELSVTDDELAAWAREFRAMLAGPATSALLSRPAGEAPEVWRERRFAVFLQDDDGRERFVTGAFDRVVVRRSGGRPVGAEVIDHKTDRPPPDRAARAAWLAERRARHAPQLGEYRRALASMLGLPASAITARVLLLQADAVVEIPQESAGT